MSGAGATGGIRLEPLAASHLAAVEELVADPEVRRYTRFPDPLPPGFAARWLRRCRDGARRGERFAFAIVEGEGEGEGEGSFLGIAVVPRVSRDTGTAELGYLVAAAARGRGVATQALRLLGDWAFAELGLQRLELLIVVENEPSRRVAARAGYRREGLMRSVHLKDGVRADTELWSRLPSDP